jgi:hypothetical protein
VLNDDREKEGEEERRLSSPFFLLISEFAEELQWSANLLSTVAPHHFAEPFAEADGGCF